MSLPTIETQNYRETLDLVARFYLRRHQAEYLGDSQQLFVRAVQHLQAGYGADQAMAENTIGRAMSQIQASDERRYLDLSASTGNTAVIVDPLTGIAHSVPLHLICQYLLDDPVRAQQQTGA